MDALIEFLCKYRPVVFEKGHLVFGMSWPMRVVVLLLGAAALAAVATYTRGRVRGTRSDRLVLAGIRVSALLLLLFALLRPVLLVSAALSQHNIVGVLIDDSRSMRVADMQGRTRADVVRALLGGPDSALYHALTQQFLVRLFSLGRNGSEITSVGTLTFDGERTRIASALEEAQQQLAGAPLAGFVLASDGADNAPEGLSATLQSLSAHHVPVFTVGIGAERFAKDIEISRIAAPRTVLRGTTVVLTVDITQRGFGGTPVHVVVEDSGRLVATEPVTLPRDGEATTVRVRVPTTETGARLFTVRIAPQAGELVRENNAQTTLVTVQDRRDKILYVEGEPRFELKFLRRAVEDDKNLQLVTMLRTTKHQILRLGVADSTELAKGFPQTREELFAYRGIVLGSIEASYFSLDQLRMIADFVSERGGGLLMLGGRTSFAEGGYAGTPVANALPVELSSEQQGKPIFHPVKVDVTAIGSTSAQTQIAGSEVESAKRWKTMPVVTSMNQVTRAKPGATTFLEGTSPKGGGHTIVLASQRYGRGTAIAFPIQDSWLWQMRSDTPVEDLTYKTFWRQAFRWLISDVPSRVTVRPATDRAWLNEPLQVDATVVDRAYHQVAGSVVTATIHAPSGATLERSFTPSMTRDGAYALTFTPTERGVYRMQVTAQAATDGGAVTSDPVFVDVGAPTTEYIGAELRTSLLQRIAEETGGRYYTPATAMGLAKDLLYMGGGNMAMERLDLWDMPVILVLLLLLLAGEWGYRRARGLA